MPKKYLGMNVLEAARERIRVTFDEFERIYVSFSGGKDSTVMLHLVADEARRREREFGILFVDLEGQYKLTIDHIAKCCQEYAELAKTHWCCLPIHLRNAVSVFETHWVCWDRKAEDAWIRQPPEGAITDHEFFPFFWEGMEFEEFVPEFGEWYAQGKKTACMVGIRTAESLNRWRTLASQTKQTLEGRQWTTLVTENVYNVYPVYDWTTEDVWTYQGKYPDRPYNRLYDLMYKAGLTIHQQRICQPYGDDQRKGLWLFHLIEPETWARVVARVNGANTGAMYMGQSGNMSGYRRISKPEGHTWKSFAYLLLNSMPPKTREHYYNKIFLFRKWWMERGYPEGIPDEAEYGLEAARKVGTWRRICKSLLRNDYWGKGIGFSQHKSHAYSKYLDLMRRRRGKWREFGFLNPIDPKSPDVIECDFEAVRRFTKLASKEGVEIRDEQRKVWFKTAGGEGCAALKRMRYGRMRMCWFFVMKEFRGKGFGEALFRKVLAVCVQRGAKAIDALAYNPDFYEKMGFYRKGKPRSNGVTLMELRPERQMRLWGDNETSQESKARDSQEIDPVCSQGSAHRKLDQADDMTG